MNETAASRAAAPPARLHGLLSRVVEVRPGEASALALSFAFFFCVLCSYYIVRPLRDEVGIAAGAQFIQISFSVIFLVMLAAVPAFGWIVANMHRARIVPVVYGFFIACLAGFWIMFARAAQPAWLPAVFYVWVNVFALFVVSVFWSTMSDVWHSAQAKRLYGLVSVGGTCGALTGPLLIQALIAPIGIANLLLVSAAFLALAIVLSMRLRRLLEDGIEATHTEGAQGGGVLAGAINVWRSPYLFRIALWILGANIVGLFFYLEQARILGADLPDKAQRIVVLSWLETATSVLTVTCEALFTARIIKTLGVGRTIAVVPVFAVLALAALAIHPSVAVIGAVMVVSRAMGYGLAGPAVRVLFTVVDPRDKYRAQNFIDTVVHRGGNAASGWLFSGLGKGAGLAAPLVAVLAIPFALAWAWLSLDLGRRQERQAADQADG